MDTAQPGSWRPRSHWIGITVVFFLQVGLVFWLGEQEPIRPRPPATAPVVHLAGRCDSEFLALNDPTLFALPHHEGFSGMAWLEPPPLTNASFHWTEEPRWLRISGNELGATFKRSAGSDVTVWLEAAVSSEPNLYLPGIDLHSRLAARSLLRIEGALAEWRILQAVNLPSWPARAITATDTDLLTNTIVQLVVDGLGQPRSATLLRSSGLPAADEFALEQVRLWRFEPPGGVDPNSAALQSPLSQLSWGRLTFEWHTVPAGNPPLGTSTQ